MNRSKKEYPENETIKIKKIIDASLIDWEGMIVTTLYVGGCNFRCPFCYNTDLVLSPGELPALTNEKILSTIREKKSFLDGICLSGGEPTIFNDLAEFLELIKNENLKVKLDTNGSHPEILKTLLEKGLVDYVAMDVKNTLEAAEYKKTIGITDKSITERVSKSIQLLLNSQIDYEFRTTVVPGFHDSEKIEKIANELKGAKRYVLQNFIQSERMLDPNLNELKPFNEEKMLELKEKITPYVQKSQIR